MRRRRIIHSILLPIDEVKTLRQSSINTIDRLKELFIPSVNFRVCTLGSLICLDILIYTIYGLKQLYISIEEKKEGAYST